MSTKPFIVLAGPTGVGKTALSLVLAHRIGAEIISADSRQIYRGLDIGTAKPTAAERLQIPHHFIDERNADEPWSAGAFAHEVYARIEQIVARGRVPLVVGGSTLYLESLVHGLADLPPADLQLRAALNQRAETPAGADTLYQELARIDPRGAATLDPTKTQRLVRALVGYYSTGMPWWSYFDESPSLPYSFRVIVLNRPRAVLYARINARVEAMLEAGLVEEDQRLFAEGIPVDRPPLSTIGYKEPMAYLRGEISYERMVELLKRNTRRYAKRQLTWFRRRSDHEWIDIEEVSGVGVLELLQ